MMSPVCLIPLGDHCASAILLRDIGLRKCSYPFDWYVHRCPESGQSVINMNIELLLDLLDGVSLESLCDRLLGNCVEKDQLYYNDVWFAHEKGTLEETNEKYLRRFERLYRDVTDPLNVVMFLIIVRDYVIAPEVLEKLCSKITCYNENNCVILVSGKEYLYPMPPNVLYKYIPYNMQNYWDEDFPFRDQIEEYLRYLGLCEFVGGGVEKEDPQT